MMHRSFILRTFFLTLIVGAVTSDAFGFGREGHKLVAQSAQTRLSPSAAQQVKEILNGQNLVKVAGWADAMRGNQNPFWQGPANRWHYLNLPYQQANPEMPGGTNAYQALLAMITLLNDEPISDPSIAKQVAELSQEQGFDRKAFALKWIVHLVADLHQPLHVGYAMDHGGNGVKVYWKGEGYKLHYVWDTLLIREYSKAPLPAIEPETLDVKTWVLQTRELLPAVYRLPGCPDFSGKPRRCRPTLTQRYIDDNGALLRHQLALAAARLAALLNRQFNDG